MSMILVLFLFVMIATLIQPHRKLSAISYQMTSAIVIRYNVADDNNDESTNTEQGIKIPTAKTGQIHSEMTGFKKNGTIENFQRAFCAIGTTPHSNAYVSEYVLPQSCEMPLV
jgi:hypothetical protein